MLPSNKTNWIGSINPHWMGGKPKCANCQKEISYNKKYCRDHYPRKGFKDILHNGYVMSYRPHHPFAGSNGYVRKHRLIMEEKLGRILGKYEHVHHLNHIPTDNRIENLTLTNPSTHSKYHAAVRWQTEKGLD